MRTSDNERVEALRARQLARELLEQPAGIRQTGQRIGERILLRLLEHDRVVNDGRRLLADAFQQPRVVLGVEARIGVIHARAYRSAGRQSSGHTSADCSTVGAFEPMASRSALGRALISGRRLRATHPVSP